VNFIKGLILAGGLGNRLRPLTHTGPKQLIPIANKPVLHYCIEDLVNANIKDIGIIVGYTEERINQIKNAVGDGSNWGAKITYIEQDAPRGLAHAVWTAKDFLGNDDFVVYLGDNMLKGGIDYFVEEFKKNSLDASILLSRVETPELFGVATLDENNNVIEVEEKPKKPKTNYAITGIYIFKHVIFSIIERLKPSKRNELELTHAIQKMIESKKYKIGSYFVQGWWDDTGTTEDVLHANYMVLSELNKKENKGTIEDGAKLTGNYTIGEDTTIMRGSVIKGPVAIGKNCKISEGVYIGPFTSIGDNTIIKDGEIESSIIMGDTTINLKGKIVDSLVGRHSEIISTNKVPKGYRLIMGENSSVCL
jgi:glucose-1-phosphate thymidylyltransferase